MCGVGFDGSVHYARSILWVCDLDRIESSKEPALDNEESIYFLYAQWACVWCFADMGDLGGRMAQELEGQKNGLRKRLLVNRTKVVSLVLFVVGLILGSALLFRTIHMMNAVTECERGARWMSLVLLMIPIIMIIKAAQLYRRSK